jgi:hypothetical protein
MNPEELAKKFMKSGPPKGSGIGLTLVAGSAVAAYALWNSMFTVEAGHRGNFYELITWRKIHL